MNRPLVDLISKYENIVEIETQGMVYNFVTV